MTEDGVVVVIVERGSLADAERTPGVTGWSRCDRCNEGVILTGEQSAKVAAQTWRALCVVCAVELYEAKPSAFDHLGRSE